MSATTPAIFHRGTFRMIAANRHADDDVCITTESNASVA